MAKEKDRRLKFTWMSNGHWAHSGYSVETELLLNRFKDDGWDFAEIAFFGLEGHKAVVDDILVYPKINDPFGADAMLNHSIDFGANVAFCMQDIWTLDPQALKAMHDQKIPWIPYLPIDQEPASVRVTERLKYAYKIITFSKFGQKMLEDAGFASTYIPEGIDINAFKPMDKAKMRAKFKIPNDIFLFGMISANKENPPRKGYQEILEAFKLFLENHPNAGLFIHSQQISPNRFPIREYANYLGIANNIYMPDQYSASFRGDTETVVSELNMFDAVLNPSQTEGFGLVIAEAQACGKPVIVNNCHSMPELVIPGETGEICETNYAWWRNQLGYVYTADVKSLHEKMESVYTMLEKDAEGVAKRAREHAVDTFDINKIFKEKWIPFMEDLQTELLGEVDSKKEKK